MVVITRWLIDMVYLYLKSEQSCVYKHHAQPRSTTIIYDLCVCFLQDSEASSAGSSLTNTIHWTF
jgi:hypothetical protein